ncbi:MAG: hypothetical protein N2647_02035 [Thermodesulfovibrio sp.]|nr:hypothetical protein [Thermodesulfovibrio sp.]
MKKAAFILILIVLIVVSVQTIYSKINSKINETENSVTIAHEEIFGKLEYGKVIFKHQAHIEAMAKILNKSQELMCNECHRKNEFGDYSFDFPVNINSKNPDKIKNAYHSQCLSCHQKLSAQGKKTGPEILSCRDCHKKEYEKIKVKYPVFEFDFALHEKHVKKHEKDCSLCHHVYDIEEKNKELALVYEKGNEQSCYYCHDLNKNRGPELKKIVNIARQKGLNMEKACHLLCLNCHLQNKIQGKDAGPVVCSRCHTGKYKTIEELKETPRPEREQPKRVFIKIEEAKMKSVSFNHDFHEKSNKTCRVCHHETLKSCKECHNLKGKEEGGFISIVTAYHSLDSNMSCQGCHRKNIMNNKECLGCHYLIPPIKTELGNREICNICHGDKKEIENNRLKAKSVTPNKMINTSKIKEEVIINHLEKEFEPVKMPHYKMIKKLTDISTKSKLATYFHRNSETICRGCHHKSKEKAEADIKKPPLCVNCHSIQFNVKDMGRPRLQSAYHSMCIRCHENMGFEKPKKCTDCHERKVKVNAYN